MDLTDRDRALLIWLAVVALAGLRWHAILDLARVLLGAVWLLRYAILAFAAYVTVLVLLAQGQGLWSTGLLKETAAWFVLPGIPLLFRFTQAWEGRRFYVRTLIGALSLSAVVEFYVSQGSFSLIAELVLLPVLALLVIVSTLATARPEMRTMGRVAGALLVLLGLWLIAGATSSMINQPKFDLVDLGLTFALPIWLTAASMPFIFVFSLIANYHDTFHRINYETADKRASRRAKAAILLSFHLRNRELANFTPMDAKELARTSTWGEARRLIAYQRAVVREREAQEDVAAKKLIRYAGVEGVDWQGQPLDQREFKDTKEALETLFRLEVSQYEQHERYNADLPLGLLLSWKASPEHGIVVKVKRNGRAWYAWRRTLTGWCLGIGAKGAPPDQWMYQGAEPPPGFPDKDEGWRRGSFEEDDE